MFLNVIKRLVGLERIGRPKLDLVSKKKEADELRINGRLHEAIECYHEIWDVDKTSVEVLNSLGVCLDDLGKESEAFEYFEIAHAMDDTYLPGVVNYAKKLVDKKQSEKALPLLEGVRVCDPGYQSVYPVYGAICFSRGDVKAALHFHRKSWLANFDSLRTVNSYMFALAYGAGDSDIAMEHLFWAETAKEVNLQELANERGEGDFDALRNDVNEKLRVGYWSPDFRGHSVNYFFKPLILNHDKDKVETYLYHDSFISDDQTDSIKEAADHFFDVYLLNDVELMRLMRSHQLDVLVELAGHTSMNRLVLFKGNRFAPLQITGIGYPPTTGLSEVDAKIVDPYVVGPHPEHFYAEAPLTLPSSFWCFDPIELDQADVAEVPPFCQNGYITYACAGNISKITGEVLDCWKAIMRRVPSSRLQIRSVSFQDSASIAATISRFESAGLDLERIEFVQAVGGKAFFSTYNEVDIILDTYPFNGGTTTCFATYMGVPVITLVGESLISRMGLSAMSNLGFPEWAAHSAEEYVEKAVAAASDLDFLRHFKQHARPTYKRTALGNGKIFAQDFEAACVRLLAEKHAGHAQPTHAVPALPAKEIMRRAYAVLSSGNADAATRILDHCLRVYPHHGGAHLFVAQQMAGDGKTDEAIQYVVERFDRFDASDQVSALVVMVRWLLLAGRTQEADDVLARLSSLTVADEFDAAQVRLYESGHAVRRAIANKEALAGEQICSTSGAKVLVLVPCDDKEYFEAWLLRAQQTWLTPRLHEVRVERCVERTRAKSYQQALAQEDLDALIVVQRCVDVFAPDFLANILAALKEVDVVGISGAKRWNQTNWRLDAFDQKTAAFVVESQEAPGMYELQCLGASNGVLCGDQAVLDGAFFGVNVKAVPQVDFDEELIGADWLLEEDWMYQVGHAGGRLGVHRALGVLVKIDSRIVEHRDRYPALTRLQEKYAHPLFSTEREDGMALSLPMGDLELVTKVQAHFADQRVIR
jgi:tetratricopeptide (TPR) repeat protein